MNSLYEQEEMIAELNAREDYLSEAFGDEARTLARQAREDMEWEAREEEAARLAFIGPVLPIGYASPCGPEPFDDCPF